jgi:hypothetical protein
MPRPVLRSEIMTRIRRRTRMTNTSGAISEAELTTLVNESAAALYDLLIQHQGQEYYTKIAELVTIVDQGYLTLPDDFYRMVQVVGNRSFVSASSRQGWFKMEPFSMAQVADLLNEPSSLPETTRYRHTGTQSTGGGDPTAQLQLLPVPSTAHTILAFYIPTILLEDTSVENPDAIIDGIDGWEEWIVLDCSITLLGQEESATAVWQAKKAEMLARIEALAGGRDNGRPETVQDVTDGLDALDILNGVARRPRRWG